MNTGLITVRKTVLSDLEDIIRIERASFADAWSEASVLSSLRADGAVCFTAEINGETAGVLIARDISGEIDLDSVAVDPAYRRMGAASAMLSELFGYSRSHACELINLEVRSRNIPAVALYEKFGFRSVGLRKAYYKYPVDDAILMTRFENENTGD